MPRNKPPKQPKAKAPDPPPSPPTTISPAVAHRVEESFGDLWKYLIAGIPTLLATKLYEGFVDRSTAQPYQVLWFVLPLLGFAAYAFHVARRTQVRKFHWAYAAFFGAYCIVFSMLAMSDVLVWKRTPAPQAGAARSGLLPVQLGDWRYKLVPREAAKKDVVVVMLEEPANRALENLRADKLRVLQVAQSAARVKGLAFDFFFDGKSAVDDTLCDSISALKKQEHPIAVFSGYTIESSDSNLIRPQHDALEKCLQFDKDLGYLAGFADIDGVVRSVPLHFRDDPAYPTLSLRIAQFLDSKVEPPDGALLEYVAPSDDIAVYDFERVEQHPALLSDSFVLVGEKGNADRFPTPFGEQQGTLIHAAALHSLRTGSYIKRASGAAWGTVFFVSCFTLLLMTATGSSKKTVIIAAGILSLVAIVFSAAAIALWRIWIDVVYVLVAIWIFVPCVLALRAKVSVTSGRRSDRAA